MKVNTKEIKWIDHLLSCIKYEANIHQVMIINNDPNNVEQSNAEKIIQQLSKNFPVLIINLQETNLSYDLNSRFLPLYFDPKSTTLIVMICLSNDDQDLSQLNSFVNFIIQLAEEKSRPKCLIITLPENEKPNYEKVCSYLWARKFLDVTVLELAEKNSTRKLNLLNNDQENVTVHECNPFTNSCTRQKLSSKTEWFPDKTKNLYGYLMKVGVFDSPPDVYLKRNHNGHIIEALGTDIEMTKTLAEALNFTFKWITSNEYMYGENMNCVKEKNTGLISNVMNNEMEFIAVQSPRYATCDEILYEWGVGTRFLTHFVIVPRLSIEIEQETVGWKVFNTIGIVGLLVFIWVLARLFRFDTRNWNMMYLIQILIGYGTPREPQNSIERTVFGSFLWACFLFSTFLYSIITDEALVQEPETQFQTLHNVQSSDLELITHPGLIQMIALDKTENWPNSQTNFTAMSTTECINELKNGSQLACFTEEILMKQLVESEGKKCNKPMMKIVEEEFKQLITGIIMEAGSPFVKRFDIVMQRAIQAGLMEKWSIVQFTESNAPADDETNCSLDNGQNSAFLKQILELLLFGYISALVAFIAELVIGFIKR